MLTTLLCARGAAGSSDVAPVLALWAPASSSLPNMARISSAVAGKQRRHQLLPGPQQAGMPANHVPERRNGTRLGALRFPVGASVWTLGMPAFTAAGIAPVRCTEAAAGGGGGGTADRDCSPRPADESRNRAPTPRVNPGAMIGCLAGLAVAARTPANSSAVSAPSLARGDAALVPCTMPAEALVDEARAVSSRPGTLPPSALELPNVPLPRPPRPLRPPREPPPKRARALATNDVGAASASAPGCMSPKGEDPGSATAEGSPGGTSAKCLTWSTNPENMLAPGNTPAMPSCWNKEPPAMPLG